MRRTVAEFLEPRLCPDAIMVGLTPVAADGRAMLRAGLVWSATYDHGRLLGEVGLWDLLAGGHLDEVRRWIDGGGGRTREPLRRAIQGDASDAAALAGLEPYDQALVLLAHRAAGRPIDPAALAALAAAATDESQQRWLRELRGLLAQPPSRYRRPLTDEPAVPLDPGGEPDVHDYIATGDLDGGRRRLAAAIERARALEAEGTPYRRWPHLARACRFLTGDDQAAMGLLERARFADVRDDWPAIFGALGAARVQREKDAVLAAIEAAFDGVPFPGPRHRSLYQAEAADSYAGCDQARDHTGRWQDLPRQHILDCQWALPHLGVHSLPYYLPALMSFAVREHDQERADHGSRWIFESIEYHLQFHLEDGSLRAYQQDRHRLFTPAQLGAVARFAEYYRCDPADRARWQALARGEAWPAAAVP